MSPKVGHAMVLSLMTMMTTGIEMCYALALPTYDYSGWFHGRAHTRYRQEAPFSQHY